MLHAYRRRRRLVASLLYQTSPLEPTVIAGSAAVFIVASLAACAVPAWRALSVNPVRAIRTE